MQCERCGRETKKAKICRFCTTKESKSIYPIPYDNHDNKLCDIGCGQIARYQFKNGNLCCSKGQQYCPEHRRKNSESTKGKPSGMLGKHHTVEVKRKIRESNLGTSRPPLSDEAKKKISKANTGRIKTQETIERIRQKSIGRVKSEEERQKLSNALKGKIKSEIHRTNLSKSLRESKKFHEILKSKEYREKMSQSTSGSKNGNYKGLDGKWASFDTVAPKISFCEEVKRDDENPNIINVRCKYCNKWFRPTGNQVMNRSASVNEEQQGGNHFYCSEECKSECDIYGQIFYPRGFHKSHQDEVSQQLRKMVFECDSWECQRCNSTTSLQCHHIDPVSQSPMTANDMDSCITLCKECHKKVHTEVDGCKYHELRRC